MSDQLAHKGTIIIVLYSEVGLFLYYYCCPVKVLHGKKIRLKPSCRISASFVTLLVAKQTLVT